MFLNSFNHGDSNITHSTMFVGGGKAIFILYVRVFCPFTAIVRQPIYYQLKTFSFSADKMRSIRKLPELCLFLYFGTNHYTAVSASFDGILDQGCTGRI